MQGTDAAAEPLTVDAPGLAKLLTVCERTIWNRHAAGDLPKPRRFGRRVLWSVAEIRAWEQAGMPDRPTWDRLKVVRGF